MSNNSKDYLFQLIKSLSKSEKRSFKIYATRTNTGQAKFISLFDAIDKSESYNETAILKKVKGLKKRQLSNLKAHLYKQILISLRLTNINFNVDIQLREQIDYARILYNKGLYTQSLRILEKAKEIAATNNRDSQTYDILVFEKIIESQYITRSLNSRANKLVKETEDILGTLNRYNTLSNLSIRLYGIYIKNGHVRNQKDYESIAHFFKTELSKIDLNDLTFFEELYLYISYAWYSLIIQDFLLQYKYAQKWVNLFRNNPDMLTLEPIWYIKGMHVLLEALFVLNHYEKHEQELKHLEHFAENPPIRNNENLETLGFMYSYTSKINSHFIIGSFSEGIKLVPELLNKIEEHSNSVDPHRVLIFYYKIASLYFGAGKTEKSIFYLNKIINYPDQHLREDLHCFARILNLIAHYEMGNQTLVDYQIRSTYRFLRKMNDLNKVQEEVLKFLRNLGNVKRSEVQDEFEKLRKKLIDISKLPFQRRHFIYLDIISWLEAKMQNKPVQEVIQAKYQPRNAKRN